MLAQEWARWFLPAMGLPTTAGNIQFVAAWARKENTPARYNPLATSRELGAGETIFNSHGVKNYRNAQDGITASVQTLQLQSYGYPAIVEALRQDNQRAGIAALANSKWGTGDITLQYLEAPLNYQLPSFLSAPATEWGGGGGQGWGESPAEQFGRAIGAVAGGVATAEQNGIAGLVGGLIGGAPGAITGWTTERILLAIAAVVLVILAIILIFVPLLRPAATIAKEVVL